MANARNCEVCKDYSTAKEADGGEPSKIVVLIRLGLVCEIETDEVGSELLVENVCIRMLSVGIQRPHFSVIPIVKAQVFGFIQSQGIGHPQNTMQIAFLV